MTHAQREQLARTGVLNLGQVIRGEELNNLRALFDADRANARYWELHTCLATISH